MKINNLHFIRKIALPVISFFFLNLSLRAQQAPVGKDEKNEVIFPKTTQFKKTKLSYKINNSINNTYCYDIYDDDRLIIHQTSIPAMPGNEGFRTKTAAKKVAQFVIKKIKKGEMPPTISVEELKQLKAINS